MRVNINGKSISEINGYRITTDYGVKDAWHRDHFHHGYDLATPNHTALYADAPGTIELADYGNSNCGKTVMIHHEDGTKSIYGHLSDNSVLHNGDHVDTHQLIGYSGTSGRSSGYHLHFGMKDAQGHFMKPDLDNLKDAVTPPIHEIHTIAQVKGEMISQVLPQSDIWHTIGSCAMEFCTNFLHAAPIVILFTIISFGTVNYVNAYIAKKINKG